MNVKVVINMDNDWFEETTNLSRLVNHLDTILKDLDLTKLPYSFSFYKKVINGNIILIFLVGKCKDSLSDKNIVIETFVGGWYTDHRILPTSEQILSPIRVAVKNFMCHEVDECLFYKHKQAFDPHPKQK